jgi:mono/diheme cytochrome c family protein
VRRILQVFAVVGIAVAGVAAAAILSPSRGDASPSAAGAKTTKVKVTMTEFKFKLSKSRVPVGTVVFTVVNKGREPHDFKIAGKKTKRLAPGKSAKLTVKFKKKGRFTYLCTIPGHAAAGMKGKLAVAVKPKPKPKPTTTAPTTTATTEALQGDPVAGQAIFASSGCATCHTLAAAGATGTAAPNLDAVKPTQAIVRSFVQNGATAGGVTMPAFTNLSPADLNNIAAYVYASTHH